MNAEPSMHVVLYQPQIPQNTGNIGRTCVSLGAKLWLVRPLGFRMDAARLRRAGLDYWEHLDWEAVDHWGELEQRLGSRPLWLFTKFAARSYTDASFARGDALVFGSESDGLPESLRTHHAESCLSIPMDGPVRSLNLAAAAAVAMYEARRQWKGGTW